MYDEYERAVAHFKELDSWGVDFTALDERMEQARVDLVARYPEVAHKVTEVQNSIWRMRQYAY